MCFNPAVSWITAGLGLTVGIIAKSKNKPASLYFPPIYFALMEILQGLMYTQLKDPSQIFSLILIYTAYFHVCFQPLVINYWLGFFIKNKKRELYHFTLKLCFVGGLLLLFRVFISGDAPLCSPYESLCSVSPQIYFGYHHIVWSIPLAGAGWNYVTPSIALHMFLFFIPGILLGFYRLMLIFFILGPYLSTFITSNPSEQSSIWCIIGLWLLAATVLAALNKMPAFLLPKNK